MKKKGVESLVYGSIFSLVILIFLLILVVYFISSKSSELAGPKTIAKDLCLAVLTKNNTKIIIETNWIIEKQNNGFLVKKTDIDRGYFYPCHTQFELQKIENKFILTIN
ncbi:MAG: hypothetical protein QXP53_01515 [Candidatus Pacearchaeota archaeon]